MSNLDIFFANHLPISFTYRKHEYASKIIKIEAIKGWDFMVRLRNFTII